MSSPQADGLRGTLSSKGGSPRVFGVDASEKDCRGIDPAENADPRPPVQANPGGEYDGITTPPMRAAMP
ncbi:hypothetical protein, partial [Nocardia farcinica]|uniref:hypothetical protein n=1 Tax=Nocardia farcinica TaxID=37329 RepID=UPI002456DECB